MLPQIIDNGRKRLGDVLNELAPDYEQLSIATGYWDLPGLQLLFENIKHYQSIRLIIGQEPLAPRYAHKLSLNQPATDFPEADFAENLINLPVDPAYRDLVKATKELVAAGKLEVKIYRRSFLHAKAYIFGNYASANAVGVIGSSNFTRAGLTENTELNALEADHRIVKFQPNSESDEYGHLSWFDAIWNDELNEDWNGTFTELLGNSPVGDLTYSAYDMYIKTLYELYADEIVDDTELGDDAADVLYEFQIRNAKLLLNKLRKYGLAMLADSVGLGKTITAGAVMKYCLEEEQARRVYVIAPASLTEQWREDLAKVHKLFGGFEVISMQDKNAIEKARSIDRYAPVDLFIIDEAHNLRNDASQRHQALLEWFSDNQDSKVLLLTATPINNSLTDFANQIQLAAKGSLESFPIVYPTTKKNEVIDFFEAVKRLSSEMKQLENKGEQPDFGKVNRIMQQGLRHFLVRSTRKGIEREYGGLVGRDGKRQTFPRSHVTPAPYSFNDQITATIDRIITANAGLFRDQNPREFDVDSLLEQTQRTQHPLDLLTTIARTDDDYTTNVFVNVFQVLLLLGFTPYRAETYQHRFYAKQPEELKQFKLSPEESFALQSQLSVHNMMRVTLLKRLESSQHALRCSLENYQEKLRYFSQQLESGYLIAFKDMHEIQTKFGDDLEAVARHNQTAMADEQISLTPADPEKYNLEALRADLAKDQALVAVLIEICQALAIQDDKLIAFSELVQRIIAEQPAGKKVLVFSYYADTINYLRTALPGMLTIKDFAVRAAFTSGENKQGIEAIVKRFSPQSKGGKPGADDELDYLFATDVLSEGQNLQDCDTLINFDLHWNPVRMIQRNGRINRLGSAYESVYIYNMHPETNLESYLKLVSRLEQKIKRIKYTIGTDQSILGEAENPIEYIDDIETDTAAQTTAMQLYDTAETATAVLNELEDDETFLSEDEYVYDLRNFMQTADTAVKERVLSIPIGKWGYLPTSNEPSADAPSALALMRARGTTVDSKTDFETHIFVETTETTQPLETIKALKYIRCEADQNQRRADQIMLDRETIKRRSTSVAKTQAAKRQSPFKVTPSITRVLDALAAAVPELSVRAAIDLIVTKQDQRTAKQLFDTANRDLKTHDQLLPSTIAGFEKLVVRLSRFSTDAKEVTETTGMLYYAK